MEISQARKMNYEFIHIPIHIQPIEIEHNGQFWVSYKVLIDETFPVVVWGQVIRYRVLKISKLLDISV